MNNPSLHFYPNACAICKRFGSEVQLKRCEYCKMISYCSDEHQKLNWSHHKEICTAIRATNSLWKLHQIIDNMDDESYKSPVWIKEKFAISVAIKLDRRLTPYELEMLDFAAACSVCRTKENLYNCSNCASISYCNKHRLEFKIRHRSDICNHLKQCYFFDLYEFKQPIKLAYASALKSEKYAEITDMQSFLNKFLTQLHTFTEKDILMSVDYTAAHSEYVTEPLTVLSALNKINDSYKNTRNDEFESSNLLECEEMVIHVIASNNTEAATVGGWEVLLHLMNLKRLNIVLIGPELEEVSNDIISCSLCDKCKIFRKTMMVEYHTCVYEDYKENKQYVEPHIVVAFNARLYAYDKELLGHIDTWSDTIRTVCNLRCPFILTSYTLEEARKDLIKIKSVTHDELRKIYSDINLFASIRPFRCAEKDIAIFRNAIITIFGYPTKSIFGRKYQSPKKLSPIQPPNELPPIQRPVIKRISLDDCFGDILPGTSSGITGEQLTESTVTEKLSDAIPKPKILAQMSADSGTGQSTPSEIEPKQESEKSGETTKVSEKSGETKEIPEKSGETTEVPGTSGVTIEVPEESGETREIPEESGETREIPEESGETTEVPGTSGVTIEVPEESDETIEVPEESDETIEVPEESDETIERPERSEDELSSSQMLRIQRAKDLHPLSSDVEQSEFSYDDDDGNDDDGNDDDDYYSDFEMIPIPNPDSNE